MAGHANDAYPMKLAPLVLAALGRKPARTILTMLGVTIAFLLFGLLQGVNSAFSVTLSRMRLDRLFVDSRFASPLPLTYRARIEQIPGVSRITEISFLRGSFQDPKNGLLVIATNPADWKGSSSRTGWLANTAGRSAIGSPSAAVQRRRQPARIGRSS
jgi:hypothetical protein